MRMTTIRRTALLGLLVLGVGLMAACTGPGRAAQERQNEAQKELAERAGIKVEAPAAGGAAPAGGAAAGGNANDPVKLGQQVALQYGCSACHSIDGKVLVGPTWKGLAGHDVELVSGTAKADDDYLKESILTPNAKVVKGFQPNIMPATFGTQLKPEQIDQVIAYIKSLK